MKIRHWDELRQNWIIDAASNASNLELSNPSFLDNLGKSISIDQGFTKLANRLTKLEGNLAWIYLNGAIGGGGSGGTGGVDTYTITVAEGATVYTATESADINVTIQSGTIKKAFTLIVKNVTTNTVLQTVRIYSLTRTKVTLTGLKGTTEIELSAYDTNGNYTVPQYVSIIAGAISLSIQSIPNKTMYIGGTADSNVNFIVSNNVTGSAAGFTLSVNNVDVAVKTGLTLSLQTLQYNLRDILFKQGFFNPVSGQKFNFVAKAYTSLNGVAIVSNLIKFDITVANSDQLIIITNDISDFIPSETVGQTYNDVTSVEQSARLSFPYYLSYGLTKYNSFILSYNIYLVTSSGNILQTPTPIVIENILPNDINRSLFLTVNTLSINNVGEYYKIELEAHATSDPTDISASATKFVTFRVVESTENILTANNDIHTLLAYFSPVTGFPNQPTGTWTYVPSLNFPYEDSVAAKFPNGVKLTLKDVNGTTAGFLQESAKTNEVKNQIPGIVLSGESYGYLEVAQQMFPNVYINTGESFFRSLGFNLSFTYKAVESTNSAETIVSMGRYIGGVLDSGFEITVDKIYVKIGKADTLLVKLPQASVLTVDLDVSLISGGWYFKVFVNGVLSAVTRVLESDIDWQFAQNLYLGGRYDSGIMSNFSDVTFYDIKVYTSSQSDMAIVQNYISAFEHASLVDGRINGTLDADLRMKNFFNSSGKCIIWDPEKMIADRKVGGYLTGSKLYNELSKFIDNTYPIVLIEERTNTTNFEVYSTAIFPAGDKENIMDKTFPVGITYKDKYVPNGVNIETPEGVDIAKGVRIGLQGTSSLSYNAKNYEIYMGDKNSAGDKLLFQAKEDWLPENEFTLKADVMDSSHVNNVVIGKIINGEIKTSTGIPIKPLGATPPMSLGVNVWDGNSTNANYIQSRLKHTSDGFPCLLFIRFSPDKDGNVPEPEFKGIYNFNLGRHAYYNLGLKILKSFTRNTETPGAQVISDYVEATNAFSTSGGNGTYSVEINQNNSAQGAFQQDALPIVEFMGDVVYTNTDETLAYNKVQQFYTQMANMALTKIPKYTMSDDGQTAKKLIGLNVNAELWNAGTVYELGGYAFNSNFNVFRSLVSSNTAQIPSDTTSNNYWEYYNTINNNDCYTALNITGYYNFSMTDKVMKWENAVGYFMIALIFGMVDSMCKNLTLRNWGSDTWYTAFYDMDTAFGLNNAGQDIVEYWAHLHRWENKNNVSSNLTEATHVDNYPNSPSYRQYFASWWNRIWEVLENLPIRDSGAVGNRDTIATVYKQLREQLFPDPDAFVDNYYKTYTDQTGSIIFNYDYSIKYLKIAQTYTVANGYEDSTDFTQLKFLHGNRVIHVRDWFRKRIYFLDSVYGIPDQVNIESPINSIWNSNKVTGSNTTSKFVAKMAASSKILYKYSSDTGINSFWLDTIPQDVVLPIPGGETIESIYANDYITKFDSFKSYPWTGLNTIDLPLLEELDLSYLSNMPSADLFNGGVFTGTVGLKNIRKLNLSHVILTGEGAASYTLDVSKCYKLQDLDISYSSITTVTLSNSGSLKRYDLSGTSIKKLELKNQSFLSYIGLENCNLLTEIVIDNCNKLTSLNLPASVTKITISNCSLLDSFSLPYNSSSNIPSTLTSISIDNCPALKIFDINGQNNPNLIVNLVGAPNLETLDLHNTSIRDLTLPSLFIDGVPNFNSLISLNISRTDFSAFKYNDLTTLDYLDLSYFPNLTNFIAQDAKNLIRIKCTNNQNNPIELQSNALSNCTALTKLEGNFIIVGESVFRNCGVLTLNTSATYELGYNNFFLNDGATNISINENITSLRSCFEGCASLTGDDFNYVMLKLTPKLTSLESMFKGCTAVNAIIPRSLFLKSPGLLRINDAFNGCNLSGILYSRTTNYSSTNNQTWGLLDFVPELQEAEGAFEGTNVEWIDNRFFEPIQINSSTYKYSKLQRIDNMFRNCTALTTCVDTTAAPDNQGNLTEGFLNSKTFFTNLKNLTDIYPKEVFSGCSKVKMNIINEGSNSFLFHTTKPLNLINPIILQNTLYSGIKLYGEVKENVFGGITQTIVSGTETFYIPTITKINEPFSTSSSSTATIKLSQMQNIFKNIGSTLLQAVAVFKGLALDPTDSGIIPANIFKGCTMLNSIESLFDGLNLTNNGNEYEFPAKYTDDLGVEHGMFDDCTELRITKNLFSGSHNLKIKLIGEGFKNCQLTDVSGMFSNSGVFGIIPYRLFFMSYLKNGVPTIRHTITDMTGIFTGCWNLGYTSDRVIDTTSTIYGNVTVPWDWHITEDGKEGTQLFYKLDVSNLKKSWNYDLDINKYILYKPVYSTYIKYTYENGVYTVYNISGITFYKKSTNNVYTVYTGYNGYSDEEVYTESGGVYTKYIVPTLYVKNPNYNPGEQAFDIWYLDGYGWDTATTQESTLNDDTDLDKVKLRLNEPYFQYDTAQKEVIRTQTTRGLYKETQQNYMIPTDLFRYCGDNPNLVGVLKDLNWYKTTLSTNLETGIKELKTTSEIEGLVGRIPTKLFEELTSKTTLLNGVFQGVKFEPFVGLNSETLQRGILFPPDLFRYTPSLLDISSMFDSIKIPVGVDINTDLFFNLGELTTISRVFANCMFDKRLHSWSADQTKDIFGQIDFDNIFIYNTKIKDASSLFAATSIIPDNETRGLLKIKSSLFAKQSGIINISGMFLNNRFMTGDVPTFISAFYPYLSSYSGYLANVPKENITNAANVNPLIIPDTWKTT